MDEVASFALEIIMEQRVIYRAIIEHTPIVIGRSKDCDIPLQKMDFLSRKHFAIDKKDGIYIFKDLDSANGIYVNGEKKRSGSITENLVLQIGALSVRFKPVQQRSTSPTGFVAKEKTITEISIHGTFEDSLELQLHNESLLRENFSDGISIEVLDKGQDKDFED